MKKLCDKEKNILTVFWSVIAVILMFLGCSKKSVSEKIETVQKEFSFSGGVTVLECKKDFADGELVLQVPVEDLCKALGLEYEVCGRCGHTAVKLSDGSGDIILVQWESPYADYQNREKRITVRAKNLYTDGKTYADEELFKVLGLIEAE